MSRWAIIYIIPLVLDNGRRVFFNVQETDVGEYGVRIGVSDKRPIGAKTQK